MANSLINVTQQECLELRSYSVALISFLRIVCVFVAGEFRNKGIEDIAKLLGGPFVFGH